MVAFDTNIFIYVLQDHYEFGRHAAACLRAAGAQGTASELVYAELLGHQSLQTERHRAIAQAFLDNQPFIFKPIDRHILIDAAKLRARHTPLIGLGDAIHFATAMSVRADTFMTNDKQLARCTVPGLKIELLQ